MKSTEKHRSTPLLYRDSEFFVWPACSVSAKLPPASLQTTYTHLSAFVVFT